MDADRIARVCGALSGYAGTSGDYADFCRGEEYRVLFRSSGGEDRGRGDGGFARADCRAVWGEYTATISKSGSSDSAASCADATGGGMRLRTGDEYCVAGERFAKE